MDMDLLLSVSSGLGRMEEMENGSFAYVASEDCLACLKDLQRFLRKDDPETRAAFFKLGQFNVAKSDLVPIIVTYAHDTDLVYNALKVVTFLTMPVEAGSPDVGRQLEHMQAVREAFLVQDALKAVVTLVAEPLGRHPDMSDRDSLTVQLVVTFVRNLLAVADARRGISSGKGDHKTRLRQELLVRLLDENVLELLLIVAQHTDEAPFKSEAPLLLEVFHLIFDGISAAELLTAVDHTSGLHSKMPRGSGSGGPSLAAAVQKDDREKRQLAQASMMRHARFGATLVHRTSQGVNMGRSRVAEAPAVPRRVARNAKHHVQEVQTKRSGGSLVPRLRIYAEQILEAAYDVLMDNVRGALEPGLGISRLAKEDFLRFLQLTAFFTAYVRGKQEIAVKQKVREAHEKRKQAAAAAAITNAAAADASNPGGDAGAGAAAVGVAADEDSPFACISATMGYDTFHMVQTLWLGVIDQPINSTDKDWELQHSTLALLKEMLFTLDIAVDCGNSADRAAADRLQRKLLHDDLRESGLLPVLARLVKAFNWRHQSRRHAADLVASVHVVLRMLHHLNSSERGGFLVKRAVRGGGGPRKKKAPAEDADGADDDDLPATEPSTVGADGTVEKGEEDAAERYDPFAEEEEDEEEQERRVKDVAYNLKERIRQELAFPAVIHFYTWLLQGYASNGRHLNHYLLAFLQRIAHPSDGLDLEPMLYQLSVLRVFSRIQQDVAFHKDPAARELLPFVQRTTRNMFARMLPAPSDSSPADNPSSGTAGKDEKVGYEEAAPAIAEEDEEEQQFDGADSDERRSVGEIQREVKDRARDAKVKEQCASLMFIELLFWKNSKEAEALREDYHWREDGHHGVSMAERRAMRDAFGDGDEGGGSDGGDWRASKFTAEEVLKLTALFEEHGSGVSWLDGCVDGFDGEYSRTTIAKELKALGLKRGKLTEKQTMKLRESFEKHGGKPGYLDWIVGDLGGSWKTAQVGRHLKALGLKRGVLTANQVEQLKDLFEEHRGKRQCYQLIADGLQNGLSKGQVGSQLRKLGLQSKAGGAGARRSGSAQSGGSNDGASDSGSDTGSGSDKESDGSDGRSGSGSDSDGDPPRTDSVRNGGGKGQKRSKPAKTAKAGRRKSNDRESRERAAFKKLKGINLDSDDDEDVPTHAAAAGNDSDLEDSSGASEPASAHSPASGSPMHASTAPVAAGTDSNKRDDSIIAAPRDKGSNARRGSDGGNAGKRPSTDLAEQAIKRRKSAPGDGTASGKGPTPGERAAAMAVLQARRQQKRHSLPSRADAAVEDGSEVEDGGGAVKENIPPATREPASAGRPPPPKRRLLKKAAQVETLANAAEEDLEDF